MKNPDIHYWAHMLDESFNKHMLNEDVEGKNINRAEKYIKTNFPHIIGKKMADGTSLASARDVVIKIRQDVASSRLPYELDANG